MATYGQLPAHPPPLDPFSPKGRLPLLYQTNGDNWIILSAGPDRRYSLPSGMALSGETPPSSLVNLVYDPSNGVFSPGDLFRLNRNPGFTSRWQENK